MNNGKYKTLQYKQKQAAARDKRLGIFTTHRKMCELKGCGKRFIYEGRIFTKGFEKAKYCSRSCSNSIGGQAKSAIYHTDETATYTTVCFRHHPKECVICEEQNIVAVHHYNENHDDNRPENLVPLCPTHHNYMHSRFKYLIEDQVAEYVDKFTGL